MLLIKAYIRLNHESFYRTLVAGDHTLYPAPPMADYYIDRLETQHYSDQTIRFFGKHFPLLRWGSFSFLFRGGSRTSGAVNYQLDRILKLRIS